MGFSFWLWQHASHLPSLCYESDERSSLGERADRRRWRKQGGERVAGVGERRSRDLGKESTGDPNRVDTQDRTLYVFVTKTTRVLPTQPTMRTEKDIGSENPETTAVSGFFYANFQDEIQKISFPQNGLWGGLELKHIEDSL